MEAKPFDKNSLHKLLTNVTYIGFVRHKTNQYPASMNPSCRKNCSTRCNLYSQRTVRPVARRSGTSLVRCFKGILHCSHCNRVMSPTHSTKGNKRYRYYLCTNAAKTGWRNCPCPQIPAGEIEKFVVSQIRAIGQEPTLIEATIREANKEAQTQLKALDKELAA